MDPQEPKLFEVTSLPNVAGLCPIARVAVSNIRPALLPSAGTTYANWLLPTREHVAELGDYKFGWLENGPAGYGTFRFLPALPTVPVVKPRNDEVWGQVKDHSYYALRSEAIPDIAAVSVSALGTPGSGRYVQRVQVEEISGEVVLLTVTTTATNTITQTDRPVDPRTGLKFNRTITWTLAATAPAAADLGTDGLQSEVKQVSYNTFTTTTQPVNTRVGIDNKRTFTLYQAMVWPAVLLGFDTQEAIEYQVSEIRSVTLPAYSLCPAYAEPSLVTIEEWWQLAAPADGDFTGKTAPFQPSSVDISGIGNPTAIPPCLHPAISFESKIYDSGALDFAVYEVNISATPNHTTWPSTYVDYQVEPDMGGYTIRKLTWARPFIPTATITAGVTPA